jgi:hypothetical protein
MEVEMPSDESSGPDEERRARPRHTFPLWVGVSLAIAVVAIAAFLILHLTGNGMAGMHG